jgi:hypothetical protein
LNSPELKLGKYCIAVVTIGFQLEKSSEFFSERLVKYEFSKYTNPRWSPEDYTVFYDGHFSISREGKLLALSDYVCKLIRGKHTHGIQLDDYDES